MDNKGNSKTSVLSQINEDGDDESILAQTYWIIDHDELCWVPGVLVKDVSATQMHVQCIVDEDYYAIEKPVQVVHKTAIEGRENLTDLTGGKEQ